MTSDNGHDAEHGGRQRIVDPSDAVTGLAFVFGVIGAVIGVLAAIVLSAQLGPAAILYCLIGGLAGASAGLVTGGMIGAIFSVARGASR